MADGQIAIRWLGVYSYDQSGSFPEAYVDTNFELQLRIGWFGRFRGTVLDAEPGILEPATIRGKLTADRITFDKRYGSLWVSDELVSCPPFPGSNPIPSITLANSRIIERGLRAFGKSGEKLGGSMAIAGSFPQPAELGRPCL